MKKILFSIIFSSLIFTGCSAEKNTVPTTSTETVSDNDQIIITYADNKKEDHPSVVAINKFADDVYEKSNGRIKIEIHPNSELGSEREATKALLDGEIQMERVNVATLAEYNPEYNILMLPYLYTSYEQMFRVLESDYCYDFMYPENLNIIGLTWYNPGSRSFYTVDPIYSLEDLKGLNIRIMESDLMHDYITSLGANPVELPITKIPKAFEKGIIDGAENNIQTYVSEEHYKYAKYITLDNHIRSPQLIIINKEFFNSLSAEDQELLISCANDSSYYQRKLWEDSEAEWIETAQNSGAVFINLYDDETSRFKEESVKIYQEYLGENSKLLDQILSIK